MSPCTLHDIINAMDESISTIQHLSELAAALDDGGTVYFQHALELLSLIAREATHLNALSSQLARVVLPKPYALEDQR